MKSGVMNLRIIPGRLVTETIRVGSAPLPLKCWYHAFIGIEKYAPSDHSNVCFRESSYQTEVAPRPLRT